VSVEERQVSQIYIMGAVPVNGVTSVYKSIHISCYCSVAENVDQKEFIARAKVFFLLLLLVF
jgi:hypothetical protein